METRRLTREATCFW